MKWDARLRSGRYRLGGRARLGSAQPTHQKSLHYFASDKKLECAIMLNIHMHILINAGNVVDGSYFSFAKSSVRTGLIFPWKVIGSFASLHVIQLCIRVNKWKKPTSGKLPVKMEILLTFIGWRKGDIPRKSCWLWPAHFRGRFNHRL